MTKTTTTGRWAPVVVALVFLVALNLRPALTSVGPLLPQIGDDLGLNEGMLGLIGTLPLLAFALVSPLVQHPARRFGMERTLLAALIILAAGVVIRSYTGNPGLWAGTMIAGCAIAIGNVLVPTIVKRDYARHVSLATGIYSACITVAASVASVVAVPLAGSTGWRGSLAIWAILALVVALLWIPRARAGAPVETAAAAPAHLVVSVWQQPTAWLVTAFMGLQSTTFYVMITWLPTIERSTGISAEQAGVHLFLYQLVGVVGGLAIPHLMRRPDNQTAAAITASVPMAIGAAGLLSAPALSIVWVVIAGLGSGASLVVALSLISLRGRSHRETTQLSGMAQSLGYLFAAIGPVTAGFIAEHSGTWRASLALIGALAIVQIAVAVSAGRDRRMAAV